MLPLNAGIKNTLNAHEENLTMDIASVVMFFLATALAQVCLTTCLLEKKGDSVSKRTLCAA